MTVKTTKLRDAISLALAVSATALSGTGAALAQETPAEGEATTLDRIEVTGSRIKRVDVETSQPVLTLDRKAIESSGVTSIGDVLQQISTNGSALNTTFNNGGNGQTQVDLRNLGSNRTLVLVNGRRWVTGLGGAVDLNTIPIAAVERVEVLKDGASAIYGSDAIAGVVNIITRQSFEGASASALIGTTSEGDGTQQAYDFIIGGGSERSNVLLGANYVKQEPVFAGDREISRVPSFGLPPNNINAGASSTSRFGRFDFASQGSGQLTLIPGAEGCINNQECPDSVGEEQFRPFAGATDGFNFAPENYLSTPQERIGLFGQARFDITDSISFKAEALYNERRSEQYLAPQPVSWGETLPPGFNSPVSLAYTFNLSADSIYNPFNEDITRVQIRFPSFSPRRFSNDVDTFRFAGGFDGNFEIGDRYFSWDVGMSYTDNHEDDTTTGLQNLARIRDAVGPSMIVNGVPICVSTAGDPTTIINGCVPLNVMGNAEDMSAEMVNYVNYVDHATIKDEQKAYTANLTGDLFELPGGMMAFATGVEHREVNGAFSPDALASSGLTTGSAATATAGGYTVDEVYAELSIPLLKDIPGADLLEFSIAARYSDYNTFGDTMNPKFGFKWKPFEDLLVRGNWSKGFRAPSINELFAGTADNFPTLYDPCSFSNLYASRPEGTPDAPGGLGLLSQDALDAVTANCVADGVPEGYSQANPQIRTTVGGNPNLQPETSTSKTLGLVWSPGFVEGLSMSLDWWQIEIKDPIQAVDIQDAIDACYLALPGERDTASCSLIIRDPTTGDVADVNATLTNQGSAHVEGYDFTVDYFFDTSVGKFTINWDSTYLSQYDTQTTNGADFQQRIGSYSVAGAVGQAFWRLRSNLNLGWERGDWDVSMKGRWYSALQENCQNVGLAGLYAGQPELENLCSDPRIPTVDFTGAPVRRLENVIDETMYWDMQVGVKLPWNARASIGVNNLFDEDPPIAYTSFANSFDPQYELPGQFYYFRYDQKF